MSRWWSSSAAGKRHFYQAVKLKPKARRSIRSAGFFYAVNCTRWVTILEKLQKQEEIRQNKEVEVVL